MANTNHYIAWTWKSPFMLHWMLNPVMAFREILFGQRIPKLLLVKDIKCKNRLENAIVPCPHCDTHHPALKWLPPNTYAFGNWFGLYCDHCGGIIPAVMNVFTILLLVVTFPLWIWFKGILKVKWLEKQKAKSKLNLPLQLSNFPWWYLGISYGITMFVGMAIIMDLIIDQGTFSWDKLLLKFVFWMVIGAAFGLGMDRYDRSGQQKGDREHPIA